MILFVVLATIVVMEPLTYAAHRWLMHGVGVWLHQSHHSSDESRFELNDWFPVAFSSVGLAAAAAGASVGSLSLLLPVSIGAGLYGLAYLFVHDVYIHRRLRWFTAEIGVCERLKAAHRIHHIWHGEPFGMLLPIVPAQLRRRAGAVDYDPFPPSSASGLPRPSSGSRPPHVPTEA